MSHYETAGNQRTGPMGPPEKHHLVCRDCGFEEICSTEWAADATARTHRGKTEHELALARVE